MAQETLDRELIPAGEELVRAVRSRGIEIQDAFWYFNPEADAWNLVLAAPQVVDRGTKDVYYAILSVARESGGPEIIDAFDVKVVSPLDPLARAVNRFQQQHPAPLSARVRSGLIGDVYVEGLYLYPRRTAS